VEEYEAFLAETGFGATPAAATEATALSGEAVSLFSAAGVTLLGLTIGWPVVLAVGVVLVAGVTVGVAVAKRWPCPLATNVSGKATCLPFWPRRAPWTRCHGMLVALCDKDGCVDEIDACLSGRPCRRSRAGS
jgi:hypothetical protein